MTAKSRGARLKEYVQTPEAQQKFANWFADLPPEERRRFGEMLKGLARLEGATAGWDQVRLGPDGKALFEMPGGDVLFEEGDDWFFRPFYEGSCRYEALVGKDKLDLVDNARMNFLIALREARAKTPPAPKTRPARSGQRGGRPPVVREAVKKWLEKLPLKDRELSDAKLAKIWKTHPTHEGGEEYVRQVIGKLRAELKKT